MTKGDWREVDGQPKLLAAPAIRSVQLEFYRKAVELRMEDDRACLDALAERAER